MDVTWQLARVLLRRRAGAFAGLALLVALGAGVALAAVETADRTQDAYPDYLRRADVGELVVNPSLATERAEQIIASTPGVADVTSDDFLIASLDEGEPRTQAEVDNDDDQVQLHVSTDGRYISSDRPVVHEGRMVRVGDEAFVSRDAADVLGLEVGDVIPLAFWEPSYNTPGLGPVQDDVVENVGTAEATVVGIGVFADEVLADELYHRHRVLVTPDVAGDFTCTMNPIDPDAAGTMVEAALEIIPPRCALAYRYFSLQLTGGDAAAGDVAERLNTRFDEENELIPDVLREADVGYILIPSATRDERERLDRSLRPAVGSLHVFALGAGVSTAIVSCLLLLRLSRREIRAAEIWRQLGLVRAQRVAVLATPAAIASAAGIAGASLIGVAASGLGPIASARALVPDRQFGVSASAALLVLGATAIVLAIAVAAVAVSVARARPQGASVWSRRLPGLARTVNPVRALGIRAAAASPSAAPVLLGSITGVAVVLASVVFSTSLGGLITTPARYGWPYDAAMMIGFGYGGADEEALARTLDRPDVERWGLASLIPITVEGRTVGGIAGLDGFADMPLDVVDGRRPVGRDEVALGSQTASELDLDIGDTLEITSYFGSATVTMTGTVVLPAIGPYESDRASTGTGVLLPRALFDDRVRSAEREAGIPEGSIAATGLGAFVAVDLADGVDTAQFFRDVHPERLTWDRSHYEPFTYADPVRPAAIADAASLRGMPVALGGLFAFAMAFGLFVGIAVATRSRARELAVLRALGAPGRELRATVRWHALTVVTIALVIGAPLGILAGRLMFRSLATDLGVVPRAVLSAPRITAVAAGAIAIGVLAAALPGRRAARRSPAQVLNDG